MRHACALLFLATALTSFEAAAQDMPPTRQGIETRSVTGSDGHNCIAKIDGVKPVFGKKLRAMYSYSGQISEDDEYAAILRHEQYGIVDLELNGNQVVIINDFVPLESADRFSQRFRVMCDLEKLAKGTLQGIQFYKFRKGDKAGPPTQEEIDAITRKRNERAQQQPDSPQRLPGEAEADALFRREWSAGPSQLGASFGFEGSRFGEIRELRCDREAAVFRCVVGVTLFDGDTPKYQQRTMRFKRDPQHCCDLQRYEEHGDDEEPVLTGPPPKHPSAVNRLLPLIDPGPVQ